MSVKKQASRVIGIMQSKHWKWRRWKALSGSVYILGIQGNKQCLVRVSDHPPNPKKAKNVQVHVNPTEDGIASLATVLDGILSEVKRLRPRRQRKKPQNGFRG